KVFAVVEQMKMFCDPRSFPQHFSTQGMDAENPSARVQDDGLRRDEAAQRQMLRPAFVVDAQTAVGWIVNVAAIGWRTFFPEIQLPTQNLIDWIKAVEMQSLLQQDEVAEVVKAKA